MNKLRGLEEWLEGLFEGTFSRVFRARVQPADIAKRLERALEGDQTIGVGKVFAPNTFEAALNPKDYDAFERYSSSLERELSTYLQDRARERGLTLITRPVVHLKCDPGVRRGGVRVRAWLQDVESVATDNRVEFTQPIPTARPRARSKEPQAATLTIIMGEHNGHRYTLPPGDVITLGRGLDNQIVLDDSRVSRTHAELHTRGGEWHLRDLGSTNGTYVNGYGIRERALESGDRISLGGVEMVFHNRR